MKNHLKALLTTSFLALAICVLPAIAKTTSYNSKAQLLEPDEISHQGDDVALYLQNVAALLVIIPAEISAQNKALMKSELAALTAFLPTELSNEFVFKEIDSGVVVLDNYQHRYVVEVNADSQPGVILSNGYSSLMPVFAPYSGEGSLVNELKAYFYGVKNEKKLKKYIDRLTRNATQGDQGKQKKAYKALMADITTTIMPTLTREQTQNVNQELLRRRDIVIGYTANEAYFKQPFSKLSIATEYKGYKDTSDDEFILNNKQQQRKFSYTNGNDNDTEQYVTAAYHANGLLRNLKKKRVRHSQEKTNHDIDHIFWQSDSVVKVYTVNYRSGYARDLESITIETFTFDKHYRLVEMDVNSYNTLTKEASPSIFGYTYTYDDLGNYQLQQRHPSANVVLKSDHIVKNGTLVSSEHYESIYGKYQSIKTDKSTTISRDENGVEIRRATRSFDKKGYLKREETVRGSDGQTVIYKYEL